MPAMQPFKQGRGRRGEARLGGDGQRAQDDADGGLSARGESGHQDRAVQDRPASDEAAQDQDGREAARRDEAHRASEDQPGQNQANSDQANSNHRSRGAPSEKLRSRNSSRSRGSPSRDQPGKKHSSRDQPGKKHSSRDQPGFRSGWPAPRHPRLISSIVIVLLLGLWGSWAGPGWNPQPMRTLIVPESPNTHIKGANPTAKLGTYKVQVRQVQVPMRDGTTVNATLKMPLGLDGLAPAMVFVHGTGTNSHTSFEDETDMIASSGVATLVTDKRTNNYTTAHRDYLALAKDYEDAFDYLVGLDGVDPKLTGLYTVSEGCYVGPIVASGDSRIAFVVFVSAPVLPMRTQGALAADTYLRNLGAPRQIVNLIAKLVGQRFGDGFFDYIDFDVSQYQKKMTMPVLMIYGTNDMSMPVVQGPLALRNDLAKASNSVFTLRYYDGADHGLKIGDNLLRQPMQDVSDWVNGMPSTAHTLPHVAGANPTQTYMAQKVAAAPTYASGMALLVTLAAGVGLVCAAGLVSLLGLVRVRGRRLVDLRGCGRALNAASAGIVTGYVAFAAYVVLLAYYATSYQRNSFVVQSGWLACQFLALLAVWLFVRAQFALGRTPGRFSWPARLTIAAATAGQVILFLSLGYWGLYPSLR